MRPEIQRSQRLRRSIGSGVVLSRRRPAERIIRRKGVAGTPSAEGIRNTRSTHNPDPSTGATGMEDRSGTEIGSDT